MLFTFSFLIKTRFNVLFYLVNVFATYEEKPHRLTDWSTKNKYA